MSSLNPLSQRQHSADYFDRLFALDEDPWHFKSRWYEQRKRALTLACLPVARYASIYEPGCANGELSAALAQRCDQLVVSDGSHLAVQATQRRLAGLVNVQIKQLWVPAEWPEQKFDLIVISELAYYLSSYELDALAQKILHSLQPQGSVLACHWRRPIQDCQLNGDQVHQQLEQRLALSCISQLLEADFRIDVWSKNPLSVAQKEGFA